MNIIISNSLGEPIYLQIEKQIKDAILKGNLSANETLPSIRALAKELGISVITTKRAYEELESQGYIYTVPGKGSFIAHKDKEFLREEIIKKVEDYLMKSIEEGEKINLSLDELIEILRTLYCE